MFLMIVSGLFATLLGVVFGCTVIEVMMRAMIQGMTDHPAKGTGRPRRVSLTTRETRVSTSG